MGKHTEQLLDTYRDMDTEWLLARIKSGNLTEEAHALALKELQARDINISQLPPEPSPSSTDDSHKPELSKENGMKISTKIITTILVVVIGSTLVGLINEALGHGGTLVNIVIVVLLFYVWSKPSIKNKDKDRGQGSHGEA